MYDEATFESATMLLGASTEDLCRTTMLHIVQHGIGKSGSAILGLPADTTDLDLVMERFAALAADAKAAEPWDAEDIDWLVNCTRTIAAAVAERA